jgi:hypothetical protein
MNVVPNSFALSVLSQEITYKRVFALATKTVIVQIDLIDQLTNCHKNDRKLTIVLSFGLH